MNRRGLTPLTGFVILVGIVAIGAMSVFVAGMALAEATQSDAEQQQLERSMVQFADTANEIAISEHDTGGFEVIGTDGGSADVSSDAGHIEMWVENDTHSQTLLNDSLGAYRYETAEGEQIAFQGGGVWRSSGDGSATFVQPPPFDYRNEGDPTLTYEFVKTVSQTDGNGTTNGKIKRVNKSDRYPRANDPNPLKDGSVYVEIESEYCEGWENFFRQRTDGDVYESCSESIQSEEGEVRIQFIVPFEFPGSDGNTVVAQNVDSNGNGNIAGDMKEGHDLSSADNLIESRVNDCDQGDGKPLTTGTSSDSGLYCTGTVTSGEYVIDTSSGDIEIAVDGRWDPQRLEINGPNNVTFYIKGDAYKDIQSNTDSNFGQTDPDQHRIFLHSSGQLGASPASGCDSNPGGGGGSTGWGGANLEAFIYAPGSEVAVHSNGHIKGAIIADCYFAGGNSNTNPEPGATNLQLEYEAGGEPFYYLHVSKTVLEVEDS